LADGWPKRLIGIPALFQASGPFWQNQGYSIAIKNTVKGSILFACLIIQDLATSGKLETSENKLKSKKFFLIVFTFSVTKN